MDNQDNKNPPNKLHAFLVTMCSLCAVATIATVGIWAFSSIACSSSSQQASPTITTKENYFVVVDNNTAITETTNPSQTVTRHINAYPGQWICPETGSIYLGHQIDVFYISLGILQLTFLNPNKSYYKAPISANECIYYYEAVDKHYKVTLNNININLSNNQLSCDLTLEYLPIKE